MAMLWAVSASKRKKRRLISEYITGSEDKMKQAKPPVALLCFMPYPYQNLLMKKRLFFLLLLTVAFGATAQTTDARLNQRLNDYIQLNKDLNFDKIMDYMHPNLFKIAPREALIESFEEAFNSEDVSMRIDTIRILTASPDFTDGEARYKKLDYYMSMSMYFEGDMLEYPDFRASMEEGMKSTFEKKKVSYDEKKKALVIAGNEVMFAIKDNANAEWLFLGYEKNPQLIKAVFPKAVIAHYKLL